MSSERWGIRSSSLALLFRPPAGVLVDRTMSSSRLLLCIPVTLASGGFYCTFKREHLYLWTEINEEHIWNTRKWIMLFVLVAFEPAEINAYLWWHEALINVCQIRNQNSFPMNWSILNFLENPNPSMVTCNSSPLTIVCWASCWRVPCVSCGSVTSFYMTFKRKWDVSLTEFIHYICIPPLLAGHFFFKF